MQAPSGQMTAPALPGLLKDGVLAGEWVLDPRRSSIRLKNRSLGALVRVNGAFRRSAGTKRNCVVSMPGSSTSSSSEEWCRRAPGSTSESRSRPETPAGTEKHLTGNSGRGTPRRRAHHRDPGRGPCPGVIRHRAHRPVRARIHRRTHAERDDHGTLPQPCKLIGVTPPTNACWAAHLSKNEITS